MPRKISGTLPTCDAAACGPGQGGVQKYWAVQTGTGNLDQAKAACKTTGPLLQVTVRTATDPQGWNAAEIAMDNGHIKVAEAFYKQVPAFKKDKQLRKRLDATKKFNKELSKKKKEVGKGKMTPEGLKDWVKANDFPDSRRLKLVVLTAGELELLKKEQAREREAAMAEAERQAVAAVKEAEMQRRSPRRSRPGSA